MKQYLFDTRPLEVYMIQPCRWRGPRSTITAPHPQLRPWSARAAQNRAVYMAQSAATRDGVVPEPTFD